MKKLVTVLSLLTVLGAGSVCAETWKFASEEAKNDVQDIYAQAFADSIKEQSDGDIRVRIYYYGQLGTENDIVELATKNTIQFVSVGAGHLGSYVPEIQVVSLPYLLNGSEEETHQILTESTSIYEGLEPKFESVNLKLLSMMSEGQMLWGANKAIRSPRDFENQKIRTFTSTIPTETYKAFGATPTPLSWGEVYGSLQLKTIDGMVNPPYFIYNAKWYEVQDFLINPKQQPYVSTVSVNNQWFKKQPPEKQAMIEKAIDVADKVAYDYQVKINSENLEKIKQERPDIQIIELTDDEIAQFKKRAENLHNVYLDVVSETYAQGEQTQARKDAQILIDNVMSEVEKASSM
ncbi:TRAP transporter substrate-binding protein DctP [Vibrio sp. A1-1]|uniref:TRAP transporter substrate-binding protein n=1 Tax=Vibrio sp. A1-1 TaxID=2912250 RepID=UPI001EFF6429|nr:TRAP transporter substrate-binding protein DctP [Vibrio sp. A1-1]MCF7454303.1 TRAP transporter substrate-binding protein DctP [Vibrio sp. A1-1]